MRPTRCRLPLWASAGVCYSLFCASIAGRASAQGQEDSYEQTRVMQHVAATHLRVDPAPEGKRIRRVVFERREVFEGDDLLVPVVLPPFASTWPNAFHWLTEESAIDRELLLHEGDLYQNTLAEESMRNLRDLGILALVKILPIQTGEPDTVDLLVYTRDLWSLRLEQEFSGAGRSFQLAAQLIERNFLGRDKSVAGRFSLEPDVYTIGQTFVDPRVAGEPLRFSESFDVIVNRATGKPEGSAGGLYFGRPFYNIAQRFSIDMTFSYAVFVSRDLRNGELLGFDARPGMAHGAACAVGSADCIPLVWDERRIRLDAGVHRRFGETYTQTFSVGGGVSDREAQANNETRLRTFEQREVFETEIVPLSRRDVYPFVSYRLTVPQYRVFTNLATFGLSESVRVGPVLDSTLIAPLKLLGSTQNGLSMTGAIGYVWAEHDALLDVSVQGWTRFDGGRAIDQRGFVQLRAASPSFAELWGRLIGRFYWDVRHNDTQNTFVALGGANGLRGYPAQYFYGRNADRMLWNFEYRTRPWLLQSIHFGLVAFYDGGSVYKGLENLQAHHAVGAGVRVLFPQFNRYVFRLDVGQPIGEPGLSVLLTYGSDQVVALTPGEDAVAQTGLGPNLR
jgi:hypothetical protein